ncbi:hypothetical protein M3Y98_00414800 [Aphelenchoides besseyi]|nr:hypothetical protein M3Y98_00414800 [Aphelenchoides besseyi]
MAYLQLKLDPISNGVRLTGISKSCTSAGSPSEVPDELNGEEQIEMLANNIENHVVKFGEDNVLMCAFKFIDLVVEMVDKFEDRLTIKSVESKIYEQKKPIEKKLVYYANYPTDRKDDHRGGIIYGAHSTHCRQSRS